MLDFQKNYFELFGLSVGYIVDTKALAEHYRELQKVVHPDRFANASEQERRLSQQGASLINEAYQTLKDPLARARYLLSLHGIDMDLEKETTQDTAFLMEQLSLREELEQMRHQPDPHVAVADLLARVNQNMKTLIGQMAVQFETATPDQLEEAREIIRKMQFLQKLRTEAEQMEAALEDAL